MPPSIQHQRVLGFLYILFTAFLAKRPLGEVFQSPVAMKLPGKAHGREPDLLFVSTAHTSRIQKNYVDGPADLVVEIISPESIERDTVVKFAEYQAAAVSEYLLIDLDKHETKFYRLGSDHRYQLIPLESDGALRPATIPGFRLPVALLWQDPLPDPVQTIAIVEAMLKDG